MYRKHNPLDRIHQGDILQDVSVLTSDLVDGEIEISSIDIPYAVVMTQDCDLDRDYKNRLSVKELDAKKQSNTEEVKNPEGNKGKKKEATEEKNTHDKYLPTILICPAYLAEKLRTGTHLNDLKQTMNEWKSKQFTTIKQQKNDRFHYLDAQQNMGVTELVIDFKHYYTISRDVLYYTYEEKYLASLNQLFREYLSQRFSYYLSRIGLPDLSNCEQDEVEEAGKLQ